MQYYEISEETARRSHEMMSMTDYREGSATAGYRAAVDEAAALVEAQKAKVSPFYHDKLDALLDRYARRLAQWTNDHNRNGASCPSVLVCGPSNFPTRKKAKQNAREDTLWKEYNEIQEILSKIKSVGTGPIDLTDPYAREMLEDRLQSLQNTLETGKAMNAHYRKHKTVKGFRDYSDETAAEMDKAISSAPAFARTPFPDFELSSLRGKIKRVQENLSKLDKMDAAQGQPEKEELFDGGRVVHNVADNRLQIYFDEIPADEIRAKLKSYGFHWSRRNQAWQRQLTRNAIYDARRILNVTAPAKPATSAEDAEQEAAPPAPAPEEQPAPSAPEITAGEEATATEDTAGIDGFPQYSIPGA